MTESRPFDGHCPFCGEGDFDLPGLKIHFERGWCEPYNNIKLRSSNGGLTITVDGEQSPTDLKE